MNIGKQLAVRPVLDVEASDTHGWSVGASDGDHNIHLDALEEGLTRLVAALPSADAESKGQLPVTLTAAPASNDSLESFLTSPHDSSALTCVYWSKSFMTVSNA